MSSKRNKSGYWGIQTSLIIPIILFTWFAWQGFGGMAEAEPNSWKWLAGLLGGIASLIMVSAGIFGVILYLKKSYRLGSQAK